MRTRGRAWALAIAGLVVGLALGACVRRAVRPPASPAPLSEVEIRRATDSRLLQPAREIAFEAGKAPTTLVLSDQRGAAYVSCIGRRLSVANPPTVPAELCSVDLRSARVIGCIRSDPVYGLALSENQVHLAAEGVLEELRTTALKVYDAADLAQKPSAITIPWYSGLILVDNNARVYLARASLFREDGHQLERIANGKQISVRLDRAPVAMVFGRDERVLYVSLEGQRGVEGGQPARLLVVDPEHLRTSQTVPLEGQLCARTLQLWRGGNALLCTTNRGIIESSPIADEGRLGAPQVVADFSNVGLMYPLEVDEKRGLAYCMGLTPPPKPRWVLYIVDLRARRFVGGVTVMPKCLPSTPHLAVVSQTDELWLLTNALDKILIYNLDDLVRRATEAGRPPQAAPPGG
jgi:hypothetical protein